MRVLCLFQGHRWNTVRERWIPAKTDDDHESLLRFDECSHCKDVRATITHPEDYKSRFSIATAGFHRSSQPEPVAG